MKLCDAIAKVKLPCWVYHTSNKSLYVFENGSYYNEKDFKIVDEDYKG